MDYKILILSVLMIAVLVSSGCVRDIVTRETGKLGEEGYPTIVPAYTPVRDIAENPENYEGQEVTIRGEYGMNLLGDGAISDSEAYFVLVSRDCLKNRAPKMGETYTFTGVIKKDSHPINREDIWVLDCLE